MTRPRCPRGHFTTTPTDTCHHEPHRRPARVRGYSTYDLRGQGASVAQLRTATTIRPDQRYL